MKKIIVMQFLEEGRQKCQEILEKFGVKPDEYEIFPDIHGVEKAIGSNERQLFIASSFHGIQYQFPNFIQLLRDKNPQLVCVGYCYEQVVGPFEALVFRPMDYQDMALSHIIRDFLSGALKRQDLKFNGRRFSQVHHEGMVEPFVKPLVKTP